MDKIIEKMKREKMQVMIFRDRDYPEGDDTCKMILDSIADCEQDGRTFVLTEDGIVYSFDEISRTDRYIYGKHEAATNVC